MEKLFYESHTRKYYHTLAAAKEAASKKHACVIRVWLDNGTAVGRALLYRNGESLLTIKGADKAIAMGLSENRDDNMEYINGKPSGNDMG